MRGSIVRAEKRIKDPERSTLRGEDGFAAVLEAYGQATARLERSHENLSAEVARLRSELDSANAALVRSKRLAALGEMAAGIAHEIRNPLTCIGLYMDILKRDLDEMPAQRETADKVCNAVEGLEAIVRDVLSFAKEFKVRKKIGSISKTLNGVLDSMDEMIAASGVVVSMHGASEAIAMAHDRLLLGRAFSNVIHNALEAMPDGGQLGITVASRGDWVEVVVRDTGPGIADDAVDRIFNPFFTTRATGTGLGLAIVHRIVEAHGGSIGVHNECGAVFTISLPMGIAERAKNV